MVGFISTDSGYTSVSDRFLNSFDALAKRSAQTPGSCLPLQIDRLVGVERVASGLRRPLCLLIPGTSMVRDPVGL